MARMPKLSVALLLVIVVAGGFSAWNAAATAPLAARLDAAFSAFGAAGAGAQQQGGGGGWMAECWSALTELRSCTDEIMLFFLDGESYLGRGCCLAVRTVARHCWPNTLASIVQFTAEEAGVLRGFCDAEIGEDDNGAPASAGARPPAAAFPPATAPSRTRR